MTFQLRKWNINLADYGVHMKVVGLPKGRAKLWAETRLVDSTSWTELRQNLMSTFEPESRHSRDMLKFKEHVYDLRKYVAEFFSTALICVAKCNKGQVDWWSQA